MHIGNRAYLTKEAHLPEVFNNSVLAAAPYNSPRRGKRITHAQEADWGVPTMSVLERQNTRLAVLDVVLAV